MGHLANTLDRITDSMGNENDRRNGINLIESVVADTKFADCVHRCEGRLAIAHPLMGRPFIRNDEPGFAIAHMPLHHPGYSTA